jgi:transposase InsO family protein
MNGYYNLPPEQRRMQRLVDQFNKDEQLWKKLEPHRRFRRKVLRRVLSTKMLKKLDLREFARKRPPQDCIGEWVNL